MAKNVKPIAKTSSKSSSHTAKMNKVKVTDAKRESNLKYQKGKAEIKRYKTETKNLNRLGKNKVNQMSTEAMNHEIRKLELANDVAIKSELVASGAGTLSGGIATGHDLASTALNNKAKSTDQLVQGGMSENGQFGRDPESNGKPNSGTGSLDKPITEYSA